MHLMIFTLMMAVAVLAHGGGSHDIAPLEQLPDTVAETIHAASPATTMTLAENTSREIPHKPHPVNTPLATYSATYQAHYNGIPIEAHHTLSVTAKGYRLATTARNFLGRINEEESFHLDAKGNIIPDQYIFDRSILRKTRKETIDVNHSSQTSLTRRKGREYRLDFTPGQLGPLSHQVALGRDLVNNAKELSYQVIHRGNIKEYRYQRLGEEQMDTALGKLKVLKIERVRDSDERETILWLAPSLGYQPVKLLQKEDGETYEMSIKSFTFTGKAPDQTP